MAVTGGSIQSVTVAGRIFSVASDVEATRKLGGWENEVMPNGDGSARNIKTRVSWSITGLTVECDDDRGDQEFLQELANSPDYFSFAVTFVTGVVYQGQAQLTGELTVQSKETKAEVSFMGPETLTKQ